MSKPQRLKRPREVLQAVEVTGNEVTRCKVLTEALRFEIGQPVDLDAWALARKRLYDTNVFRLVEIQPVPVGEAANGVQQVKAVVTVEEYPQWSFRYGFQLEGERRTDIEEFTNARNAGVVSEIRNPNLFGRALTGGVFGMYTRDRQDGSVFVATSRLFGWAARSTLYGFFARDRLRNDAGDITADIDRTGVSADQRWRTRGFQIVYGYRFERNHTIDPATLDDFVPFDIVANLARIITAVFLATVLPRYVGLDPSRALLLTGEIGDRGPAYYPALVTHIFFGSVMLCAAVNAVTVLTSGQSRRTRRSRPRTKSRWSIPRRMCSPPSTK